MRLVSALNVAAQLREHVCMKEQCVEPIQLSIPYEVANQPVEGGLARGLRSRCTVPTSGGPSPAWRTIASILSRAGASSAREEE